MGLGIPENRPGPGAVAHPGASSLAIGVRPAPPDAGDRPRVLGQQRRSTREALELRLLATPLYRYRDTSPEGSDGALFAFVQGTDPEVLLLVETATTRPLRNGGRARLLHRP